MHMSETEKPIIEMRGIDKHYGGVHAVKGVDLDIYSGEVHALVGDNAAGKSTLIKILSGAVARDGGTIFFESQPVEIAQPRDAKDLGIETVYQDLALADNLDVASNVFLGREKTKAGMLRFLLDSREMRSRSLLSRLKINIPHITACVNAGRPASVDRDRARLLQCARGDTRPTAALGVEKLASLCLIREMRIRAPAANQRDQPRLDGATASPCSPGGWSAPGASSKRRRTRSSA
jgi:ABC-type sugar transport system ATPase subunit